MGRGVQSVGEQFSRVGGEYSPGPECRQDQKDGVGQLCSLSAFLEEMVRG